MEKELLQSFDEKGLLQSFDEQGVDSSNTGILCSNAATQDSGNPNAADQSRSTFSTAPHIRTHNSPRRRRGRRLSRRSLSDRNHKPLSHQERRGQVGRDRINMDGNKGGRDKPKNRKSGAQRKRIRRMRALEHKVESRLESDLHSISNSLAESEHLSEPEPDLIREIPRPLQYKVDLSLNDESIPSQPYRFDSEFDYFSELRSSV